MVKVIINTVSDITRLQVKLRALKAILPRLQDAAAKDAAEDILDEIHAKMKQNNFSEKIIDATFVGKLEKFGSIIRQHFISNYVSETGFDVSKGREEGTDTHTVLPKKPGGVLRWIAKTGEIIFRKKSRPKGIERLLIIEKTLKKNTINFGNNYSTNLAASVKKVLGV